MATAAKPYRLTDAQRDLVAASVEMLGLVFALPGVRNLAYAVGDPEEARSLAAVGLCRAARGFDPAKSHDGSFYPYAIACMRSALAAELARRSRKSRQDPTGRPLPLSLSLDANHPGHIDVADPAQAVDAERDEDAAWLRARVAELPAAERRAVELVLTGLTMADAGRAVGLSRERVRQLYAAALGRLRAAAARG